LSSLSGTGGVIAIADRVKTIRAGSDSTGSLEACLSAMTTSTDIPILATTSKLPICKPQLVFRR